MHLFYREVLYRVLVGWGGSVHGDLIELLGLGLWLEITHYLVISRVYVSCDEVEEIMEHASFQPHPHVTRPLCEIIKG